jgi:hypothetical protein
MILLVELAQRITRKLDVYFSIVRRRADWASRDMPSASLMITTAGGGPRPRISLEGAGAGDDGGGEEGDEPLKRFLAFKSTCCVCAMSLRTSWTTARS